MVCKVIGNKGLGLQAYVWTFLLIFLASCSSTKNLKKTDALGSFSETAYMEKVLSYTQGWDAVTAKMSVSLKLDGKNTGKVNGTLRIKRGEVIQISLTPFLGIEVGRAEISPEGLLVIDRMNKRYVQVNFEELQARTHVNLSYPVLEALFLNEMFLPGKEKLTMRDKSLFDWTVASSEVVLNAKKTKTFNYQFRTEAPDGWLKQSHIGLTGTAYALNWMYDEFEPLEQSVFPTYMHVSFDGGKKPNTATFNLSRLSVNADWETHTEVSRKYQKVELEDVIKMLAK